MQYYIFKRTSTRQLTHIDTKEKYKDARNLIRGLRQDQPPGQDFEYRMILANNQAEAEKLLSRPPDERVIGED
jgi:hypothetical protein